MEFSDALEKMYVKPCFKVWISSIEKLSASFFVHHGSYAV